MKYKQYNLNGRVFNYMLAFERYGYEIELGGGQCRITMSEKELIALGATPVDSELDEKHSTRECDCLCHKAMIPANECTCGKCGEREECKVPECPYCKMESAKTQPKEEKIEMPETFAADRHTGNEVDYSCDMYKWMQQVTNKLNGVSE